MEEFEACSTTLPVSIPVAPDEKADCAAAYRAQSGQRADEVDCRVNSCHEIEVARFPGRGVSQGPSCDYRRRQDRGTNYRASHFEQNAVRSR